MPPVFVFGTGRCGSTHLQRLISLNTENWIWGEHDGFLAPLLRCLTTYEDSANLKRFVFDAPPPDDDSALVARVLDETALLSWVNRLTRSTLREELRATIIRLFRRDLPRGWAGWGFKEVRYGAADDVPAILMEMFPGCTAAFCFRNPADTLASMLRTWNPDILRNPARRSELPGMYDFHAKRWVDTMRYFVALKRQLPRRLVLLDMPALSAPPDHLLAALRLQPRTDRVAATALSPTNRGPDTIPPDAPPLIAASYRRWHDRMIDLYGAASDLSERLPA